MNTRQSIQPSNQPAVLSLAFSSSRKRFIAGLADGFRCFRTDNCLATYHPTLPVDGGVAVAAALDDRYIAFVGGGRSPAGKPDVVIFWDAVLGKETARFHLHEPVLGVRLSGRWMVVVLRERTVVFEYQDLQPRKSPSSPADGTGSEKSDVDEVPRGPNKVKALYATSTNDHALACLRGDLLVLPAQSTGQVQLIPLSGGSKRVLRAHNSSLRCLAVSDDGTLLATASEQGTLIRVYSLSNLDQVAEFRRGSDHAIIFSLAFSPGNRWLACTSDKGTLHIFDLRPPHPAADVHTAKDRNTKDRHSLPHHRKTPSYAAHRLSAGGLALERESLSNFSGAGPSTHSSSPTSRAGSGGRIGPPTAYQGGSVQKYYGLRPPPASATPPSTSAATGVSALASAFKASGFAPRILRDVRSIASIPFHLGDEKLHWQGGAAFSWTTTPGGGRKRVRNAVLPLPGEGSGRPPKGVLGFAPREVGGSDEEGARVYVLGGGGEARWEVFEVLPAEGGGWGFVNRGFRRFLTRQFVE